MKKKIPSITIIAIAALSINQLFVAHQLYQLHQMNQRLWDCLNEQTQFLNLYIERQNESLLENNLSLKALQGYFDWLHQNLGGD